MAFRVTESGHLIDDQPSDTVLAFVRRCDAVVAGLRIDRAALSRWLTLNTDPAMLDDFATGKGRPALAALDILHRQLAMFIEEKGGGEGLDGPLDQRLLKGLEARGYTYDGMGAEAAVFHLIDRLIERVVELEASRLVLARI